MADKVVTVRSTGGDYTTVNAALAGEAAAVGYDSALWAFDNLKILVYDVADTGGIVVNSSWILTNSHWLIIAAGVGHEYNGDFDFAKYYVRNSGTTTSTLSIACPYVKIIDVQTELVKNSGSSRMLNVVITNTTGRVGDVELINVAYKVDGAGASGPQGGLSCSTGNTRVIAINCVGWGTNTGRLFEFGSSTAQEHRLYNCIGYSDTSEVFYSGTAATQAKNCIAVCTGAGAGFAGSWDTTESTNNFSDDTTAPGVNFTHSVTPVFADAANGNFLLDPTDTSGAIGGGVDLSTDLDYAFDYDVTNTARPAAWDAGAFQTAAASVTATDLVFISQPGNAVVGEVMGQFSVGAYENDGLGNLTLDTSFTGNIVIAWGTNPNSAPTPAGTLTVAAVQGIATFDDIIVNTLQTAATFVASSGALVTDTSDPFDITAGTSGSGFAALPIGASMDTTVQKDAAESSTTLAYFRLLTISTGLPYDIATGKATIVKAGVAGLTTNDITHVNEGVYSVSLTTTERNALGVLIINKDVGDTVLCVPGIVHVISDDPYAAAPTSESFVTAVWAAATRSLTDKANFELAAAQYTSIRNAILDYELFGTSKTIGKFFKMIGAVLLGKTGATSNSYRNVADTAEVVTATVDSTTKARSAVSTDWDNA